MSRAVGGRLPIVAIDGPAGAGKSTLARLVADRAGYLYIDTGAMYRAVALVLLRRGWAGSEDVDPAVAGSLAEQLELAFRREADGQHVLLGDEDVTEAIRAPEVDRLVPRVAAIGRVRQALVPRQRALARAGGVVMDGRDIGTEVLPDADFKFFVTAAFERRVERRCRDLEARGEVVARDGVAASLAARDALDQGREVGPLRQAPGAVLLDTTNLDPDEAADRILSRCGLCGDQAADGVQPRVPAG